MAKILLAEDDEIMRVTLYDRLVANKWQVDQAADGRQALVALEKKNYHLVISDIRMPGLDGLNLLHHIKQNAPKTDVILITAYGGVEDAVSCLKQGAADYILKPFDMDDLTIRVNRILQMQEVRIRCAVLEEDRGSRKIIGHSQALEEVRQLIRRVAPTDSTVLITGESGTGKELVADAIHRLGRRAEKPFIRINCGAIPENLIESELFGHERGAFTGALTRKMGKFELADGGTLLLDEIGDLPLQLQVKLLRVLQERELERLGGTTPIAVDVRILCATAKNLIEEVRKGAFREDLFYRLQVIPIEVPPLRKRKEDIAPLADYFLEEFSRGRNTLLALSRSAMECLMHYDFPGNIRELRNIVERLSVLAAGPVIEIADLPADLREGKNTETPENDETLNLAKAVARAERQCILHALDRSGGNKTETARMLGISRKNLWEKMKAQRLE